jgi:carboxypeptidase Taq
MNKTLAQLRSALAEIADIQAANSLLSWDQQTYMPPQSAEGRGYQISTLESIAHVKFTSAKIGRLLDKLQTEVETLDPNSDDRRLVEVTRRDYEKLKRVPTRLVTEFARATSAAHQAWYEARLENNFQKIRPHFERIFDLRREYAQVFAPYAHMYDPLLDDFEPGFKTNDLKVIFDQLRPQQVAIAKAISQKEPVDDTFLHLKYDLQKQWNFGVRIISRFGYDWQHGRQDKSAHPFTQEIGLQDVRITTRLKEDYLNTALFGTMHECGHALYEQGIDHALARSPLGAAASLAVHESQSRMWENLVGRSRSFWEGFYPELQKTFPNQLKNISLDRFYKGINKVHPSLIRVEADEATYNLHIMLRLEIEIELIEGKLEVKDLPERWNARMQEYLDVLPTSDTDGVLQDIHWSSGLIGYFPTYALGNLISAQLWECINQQISDLPEQIRRGDFSSLLGWLRQNVHRYGAKYRSQELVQRITGSGIDPSAYIRYLQKKYGEIYGI